MQNLALLKPFVPLTDFFMLLAVAAVAKVGRAGAARVWPLTSVYAHVTVLIGRAAKHPATD